MSQLEILPFELMVIVLENLDSPEDLASIIRASPCALAALQCDRHNILTKVICNNLTPGVRKEIISLLKCPVLESGDDFSTIHRHVSIFLPATQPPAPRRWYHKYTDFETWYLHSTPDDPVFSTEIPNIIAVYQIRAKVNSLIADLVAYTEAMCNLEGPYPALWNPEKTMLRCLTPCELDRMQRAFLRYELYCRLTSLPYLQHFHSEQRTLWPWQCSFLFYSDDWSFEEMRHVHDYICSKYNLAFREIDDDITALVNATPKLMGRYPRQASRLRPAPTARQLIGKKGSKIPDYLNLGARCLPPQYPAFSKGYLINGYTSNLAKLGIGALLGLMEMDRIERRRYLNKTFRVLNPDDRGRSDSRLSPRAHFPDRSGTTLWRTYCLMRLLDGQTDRHKYTDHQANLRWSQGGSIAGDAWREATYANGWTWGHPCYLYVNSARKLSWAFWDIERLKQLGLITEQSTESDITLNFNLRVRESYQEQRHRGPELHAMDQEADAIEWKEKFRSQFYTTPSLSEDPEGYYAQLKPILQLAEESKVEK